MKKTLKLLGVTLGLSLLGLSGFLFSSKVEASSVETTSGTSIKQSINFSDLPDYVKEQIIAQGYDVENLEINYKEVDGEKVQKKTRAMRETVQSACFIRKNNWGVQIGSGWNIRYKTLNIRNGYQMTGYYEVYYKKDGNNHIYDRIFTYRTW